MSMQLPVQQHLTLRIILQEAVGVDGYARGTNVTFGANILISVTDFVGECILMYRCWGVWGRNLWVIVVPFISSLTALGA